MKVAFISDIHGNYSALSAVFKKIKELKIEKIYCLGDIVNYYYELLDIRHGNNIFCNCRSYSS